MYSIIETSTNIFDHSETADTRVESLNYGTVWKRFTGDLGFRNTILG